MISRAFPYFVVYSTSLPKYHCQFPKPYTLKPQTLDPKSELHWSPWVATTTQCPTSEESLADLLFEFFRFYSYASPLKNEDGNRKFRVQDSGLIV